MRRDLEKSWVHVRGAEIPTASVETTNGAVLLFLYGADRVRPEIYPNFMTAKEARELGAALLCAGLRAWRCKRIQ